MFLFGTVLFAFLIAVYPFLDQKYSRNVKQSLLEQDRIAYFKYVIYSEWFITILIICAYFLSSRSLKDLGFTIEKGSASHFVGMFVGFVVGVLVLVFVLSKLPIHKKFQQKQVEQVSFLIPTGKVDKRYAIVGAITAGICEEVIYRGFLLHYLSQSPYQLEGIMLMIVGALIFGFAHIYQGFKGFILATIVGFAFCRIYFLTGSLLFPIIMHVLIDLRFMLFMKPSNEKASVLKIGF